MHPPVVLIVEDEKSIRDQLARMTLHAGCKPVAVEDGEQALVALESEIPDLIVTDLHMPRLGGRHLIALIRQIPRLEETPVMVVTADGRRSTKIDLLQSGADEFIAKPVDPDEYAARIKTLVRRAEAIAVVSRLADAPDPALDGADERTRELERLVVELIADAESDGAHQDDEVRNHIRRIERYSTLLAEACGCPPQLVEAVRRYAGLHDIGRTRLRRSGKPRLSLAGESAEREAHAHLGADILRAAGLPPLAVNIALHHHERWDGRGYPHRLAGDAIPLEARIVAVADAYDGLVHGGARGRPMPFEQARAELMRSAGTRLDPTLVTAMLGQERRLLEIDSSFSTQPHVQDLWA